MAFPKGASSAGGRAVPSEKRSFYKDRVLAVEAGRKGGTSVEPSNRTFFKDRELARRAGRAGGAKMRAKAAERRGPGEE